MTINPREIIPMEYRKRCLSTFILEDDRRECMLFGCFCDELISATLKSQWNVRLGMAISAAVLAAGIVRLTQITDIINWGRPKKFGAGTTWRDIMENEVELVYDFISPNDAFWHARWWQPMIAIPAKKEWDWHNERGK